MQNFTFEIYSFVKVNYYDIIPQLVREKTNIKIFGFCIDTTTSRIDGSQSKKTNIQLGQEPDEVKVSCPDLLTGVKVTRSLV